MPRKVQQQALSAVFVRTAAKPGMYADGNGLNLKVVPSGARRWVQRVTIWGKRHNIGLGGYPAVSLAEARELAAENQRLIRQGRNPLDEKRQALEELQRPSIPTFALAAEQVIEMRRPTWSNAKHASQWTNTLRTYAYPVVGRKPVDEITTGDVLAILTPVWTAKPETASRVRQRLETVFDWAIFQGMRMDNPAGKGILRVLPRTSRLKGHHTALPYRDVPGALQRVRESTADLVTRLSFELLVLTAARSNEVRLARWPEVDWEKATWTVPEERMKARRMHRVPLSGRCLEILAEAKELGGQESGLVFPSGKNGKPLSDMVYTAMLRRLEIPAVAHGFRSSFKKWCLEAKDPDSTWLPSEAALAHNLGNSTQEAYIQHTDLLEVRRPLMEEWAEFCGVRHREARHRPD